jgi:hypothetical protein
MPAKYPKLIDLKAEMAHAHDRIAIYKFINAEVRKAQALARQQNPSMVVDADVIVKLVCAKNNWDIEELRDTADFYYEWVEDRCLGLK